MAQGRFAKEANLENITYLSDYKTGSFGDHTGLLMKGSLLLARAVIVTDAEGIVKYIHITPEVSHLPDMNKAFSVANKLITN
jgi:thiol peroxidase